MVTSQWVCIGVHSSLMTSAAALSPTVQPRRREPRVLKYCLSGSEELKRQPRVMLVAFPCHQVPCPKSAAGSQCQRRKWLV